MDELTTIALAGTARIAQERMRTETPIDAIIAELPTETAERERMLLLAAGSLAIYRDAGYVPLHTTEPVPAPALPDSLSVCSAKTAVLLESLIKDHQELLSTAIESMIQNRLQVPYELLPTIFGTRIDADLRPALRQVIGERGNWLAQFNTHWSWAVEAPVIGDLVPVDADTIWQEGGQTQRIAIVRLIRTVDAPKSREWIHSVWKEEKADFREQMIGICSINLTAEDEPLLERALDDRSEKVRQQAASILILLETSALRQRMIARADTVLSWDNGVLTVHASTELVKDPSWVRDGLPREVPRKTSQSDWALQCVLSRTPLGHWQSRLGISPHQIIKAAEKTDHATALVYGWIDALDLGNNAAWVHALWDWWIGHNATQPSSDIVKHMSASQAETYALEWLPQPGEQLTSYWNVIVTNLPSPWSEDFSIRYLKELAAYIAQYSPEQQLNFSWSNTFEALGLALPTSCFAIALNLVTLPELQGWQSRNWHERWNDCLEIISLRQRIIEEIY